MGQVGSAPYLSLISPLISVLIAQSLSEQFSLNYQINTVCIVILVVKKVDWMC